MNFSKNYKIFQRMVGFREFYNEKKQIIFFEKADQDVSNAIKLYFGSEYIWLCVPCKFCLSYFFLAKKDYLISACILTPTLAGFDITFAGGWSH